MTSAPILAHHPLFIVGAPRSGNTLARRVLMASGQIYIPPETFVLGEIIGNWPRYLLMRWHEKVWLVASYLDRHVHRPDFEIDSFTPFVEEAVRWPREKQRLKILIDALYRFMATAHGYGDAPRWGDKTPINTAYLRHIVWRYPEAQYLYLVRDGRDSVASQVKASMRDLTGSANRWVEANRACQRWLPRSADRKLVVRYEDLVGTPTETFARIFDWAGLPFQDRYLTDVPARLGDVDRLGHHAQVREAISPRSIGRWRESLSQADLQALPVDFARMMQRLGYDAA